MRSAGTSQVAVVVYAPSSILDGTKFHYGQPHPIDGPRSQPARAACANSLRPRETVSGQGLVADRRPPRHEHADTYVPLSAPLRSWMAGSSDGGRSRGMAGRRAPERLQLPVNEGLPASMKPTLAQPPEDTRQTAIPKRWAGIEQHAAGVQRLPCRIRATGKYRGTCLPTMNARRPSWAKVEKDLYMGWILVPGGWSVTGCTPHRHHERHLCKPKRSVTSARSYPRASVSWWPLGRNWTEHADLFATGRG